MFEGIYQMMFKENPALGPIGAVLDLNDIHTFNLPTNMYGMQLDFEWLLLKTTALPL